MMKHTLNRVLFSAALVTFLPALATTVACTSTGEAPTTQLNETAVPSDGTAPEVSDTYEHRIDRFSDGQSEYAGLYNNFEYKATLLNSRVREAILKRQSDYYQWEREKIQSESAKSNQELASQTTVFLSFFTPDHHNDNLADDKAIWRVYFDVNGHRYDGKVKKVRTLLSELQSLYPYHTQWNTPYMVEFAVPTTAIETQASSMTITGPLGSKTVNFRAIR